MYVYMYIITFHLILMLHHVPYVHHGDDGYNVGLAPGK